MKRRPILLLLPAAVFACNLGSPAGAVPPPAGPETTAPETVAVPTSEPTAGLDGETQPEAVDVSPPASVRKLIFIHHSSGENWLADENGGLGLALMENNYFVSDTNYGWGPTEESLGGPIGDYTDIGYWWNWFLGPSSAGILRAVYAENERHADYSRLADDPGGENKIVMFKSCFPNSALAGDPGDPPAAGDNPLQGMDSGSGYHTVANAKRIYADLLGYFGAHPEKLFVVVTAPPLLDSSPEQAANARAFNRWLVEEWLSAYPNRNVAVFDFYNVLTSNGGDPETNDLDSESGNHHRVFRGSIQYITDRGVNTSAYAADGDSHPTASGNRKATAEFLPLLNYFVRRWRG
jgi:hypothetical protein